MRRTAIAAALALVLVAAQPTNSNLEPRVAALEAKVADLQARVAALEGRVSPSASPALTASPTSASTPTTSPSATAVASPTAVPTATIPAPVPTPLPTFTFADEFNGTTLNPQWQHRYQCCGTVTMDPTLTTVSGGYLHLRAEKRADGRWYSDIIDTTASFTQTYGHFEARIRVPQGKGLWPAFWLYNGTFGTDGDEIDIVELLGAESMQCAHQTVHKGTQANQVFNPWAACIPPTGTWVGEHTFGCDWRPGYIAFSIDGRETWRETSLLITSRLGVLLNLGVGGWGGTPDATTPNPSLLDVDYVRVTQ